MPSLPITGTGLICSLGKTPAEVLSLMLAGETGFRPITRFATDAYAQKQAGQLDEETEHALLEKTGDFDLAYAMIKHVADQAMAVLTTPPEPDEQLGLVLATNFGAMELLAWSWHERHDTGELDLDTFLGQQDIVKQIAEYVGAAGPSLQLSLSCASGAAAVDVATQWLNTKRSTRVLLIGYDALTEFAWCGLSNLRTITDDIIRPFDQRRKGTIFSEGAAAAMLSVREEDAKHSLAHIYGTATNNNAFHLTAPAKEAAGSRLVMEAALKAAGMEADEVSVVSAHATGTTANDVTESAALKTLFDGRDVPVCAFKSSLGHLLGAAGLAELVIGLEAMSEGILPPVLNSEEPDPECKIAAVRGDGSRGKFSTLLTNSAGIGGNNASVIAGLPPRTGESGSGAANPLEIHLARCGWVLPGNVGSGKAFPTVDTEKMLLQGNEELADFSVKPYLNSVKGYLDPAAIYTLAAASLCLGDIPRNGERFAVVFVTEYGAPVSGFKFINMITDKGPRFASPLIFPHSYPNTAPNLVAIEFGLAGPHMVLHTAPDMREGAWYAANLLYTGQADDVLLIAAEGVTPEVIPDELSVLNGGLCCWLTSRAEGIPVPIQFMPEPGKRHGSVFAALS